MPAAAVAAGFAPGLASALPTDSCALGELRPPLRPRAFLDAACSSSSAYYLLGTTGADLFLLLDQAALVWDPVAFATIWSKC